MFVSLRRRKSHKLAIRWNKSLSKKKLNKEKTSSSRYQTYNKSQHVNHNQLLWIRNKDNQKEHLVLNNKENLKELLLNLNQYKIKTFKKKKNM